MDGQIITTQPVAIPPRAGGEALNLIAAPLLFTYNRVTGKWKMEMRIAKFADDGTFADPSTDRKFTEMDLRALIVQDPDWLAAWQAMQVAIQKYVGLKESPPVPPAEDSPANDPPVGPPEEGGGDGGQ